MFGQDWDDYFRNKYGDENVKWLTKPQSQTNPTVQQVKTMMQQGELTANGKNIVFQYDKRTTVIFRRDVGKNAHAMSRNGYPDPVDHINIEIQTTSDAGNVSTK